MEFFQNDSEIRVDANMGASEVVVAPNTAEVVVASNTAEVVPSANEIVGDHKLVGATDAELPRALSGSEWRVYYENREAFMFDRAIIESANRRSDLAQRRKDLLIRYPSLNAAALNSNLLNNANDAVYRERTQIDSDVGPGVCIVFHGGRVSRWGAR